MYSISSGISGVVGRRSQSVGWVLQADYATLIHPTMWMP
jgi:hypothetical protein